ncbi:MAG: hypothetical protein BWY32_02007 [bacterium ADurb.Bin243]|nr:MAG: hypothetical protein BWY32_02007 [bacterium ADurb.Bin243]
MLIRFFFTYITVLMLICFCGIFSGAPGAAAENKSRADALSGLKVLYLPSSDYADKKNSIKGELKNYDSVLINISILADFKIFIKNNADTLYDFCREKDFGAILIELPEIECKKLDCYVISGEEDPRDALRGSVYDSADMLALIEKIRILNTESKNAHKKIRFKSIYCAINREDAVKLSRLIKNYDEEAANDMLWLINHLSGGYGKLKKGQRKELNEKAVKIEKAAEKYKDKIETGLSANESQKALLQTKIIKLLTVYNDKILEFKTNIDSKNDIEKIKNEIISAYIEYNVNYDFYNKKTIIFCESIL